MIKFDCFKKNAYYKCGVFINQQKEPLFWVSDDAAAKAIKRCYNLVNAKLDLILNNNIETTEQFIEHSIFDMVGSGKQLECVVLSVLASVYNYNAHQIDTIINKLKNQNRLHQKGDMLCL